MCESIITPLQGFNQKCGELHGAFSPMGPSMTFLSIPMGPVFVIQTVQFVNWTNKLQDVEADYLKFP